MNDQSATNKRARSLSSPIEILDRTKELWDEMCETLKQSNPFNPASPDGTQLRGQELAALSDSVAAGRDLAAHEIHMGARAVERATDEMAYFGVSQPSPNGITKGAVTQFVACDLIMFAVRMRLAKEIALASGRTTYRCPDPACGVDHEIIAPSREAGEHFPGERLQ